MLISEIFGVYAKCDKCGKEAEKKRIEEALKKDRDMLIFAGFPQTRSLLMMTYGRSNKWLPVHSQAAQSYTRTKHR